MGSILGEQANRSGSIGHEWKAHTKALVQSKDPDVYKLLTDAQYKLPTKLPDGKYTSTPKAYTCPAAASTAASSTAAAAPAAAATTTATTTTTAACQDFDVHNGDWDKFDPCVKP